MMRRSIADRDDDKPAILTDYPTPVMTDSQRTGHQQL
jgi:hypothetical protein